MRHACFEMLALARARGARLLTAGSDASDAPAAYLSAGAEVVLHGEGFAALLALVDRLNGDVALSAEALVAGLADVSVEGTGGPVRGRATARLPEPTLAPLPAWISSTSRNTADSGVARTAISA
jgi:anaerobic magnesium-protoporphyrin IX monomethyl ester cyclase